jgi:hypothetical protein
MIDQGLGQVRKHGRYVSGEGGRHNQQVGPALILRGGLREWMACCVWLPGTVIFPTAASGLSLLKKNRLVREPAASLLRQRM